MEEKKYSELEEGVDYIDLGKRESDEIHKERTADLIKGLQEANEMTQKRGRVGMLEGKNNRAACVICNIPYKELGVYPEPSENWNDGCPFCYEKSERLGEEE